MAPSRDWACFVQRSINFKQLHPARRLLGNQYHIAGSPLLRFEWFRRKQQLHFVHHTHGNSNFAIIDNFWDRFLGTYRNPDPDAAENPPLDPWLGQSSRISAATQSPGRSGGSAAGRRLICELPGGAGPGSLGASLRDRAKPDDNARYLAQWQAEVRVVMEKGAHRHTWIASITWILH